MDAIVTMWPFLAFSMPGRNSLIKTKWQAMLTLNILSFNFESVLMIVVPVAVEPPRLAVPRSGPLEKMFRLQEAYLCRHY